MNYNLLTFNPLDFFTFFKTKKVKIQPQSPKFGKNSQLKMLCVVRKVQDGKMRFIQDMVGKGTQGQMLYRTR